MKVDLFAMPTIPATFDERAVERPVGRSAARYQMMIDEVRDLVMMADELGIDAFSSTEHHFQTEGGEVMPNGPLFYADLAARTQRIMMIPMSIVLTATNPIRAAEDVALLDHLTKGRVGVAFARGYQKRWVQILSQGGPTALQPDGDAENRERYNEFVEIVLKAWTEDAFDHNGKFFQVPCPYDTGITGWTPVEYTRKYGAEGEIDDQGVIRKIGVVPRPYQDPHPPVFIPFTVSPATLTYCVEKGFYPFIFASVPDQFRHWCEVYRDECAARGRVVKLGEGVGAVRGMSIGDTYEEAFEYTAKSTASMFFYYFNAFGFAEVFRDPTKDDPNKPVTFEDEYECAQRLIDQGWQLCGTVDQVKRQLADLHGIHGCGGELGWFQWNFFFQGTHSRDVQRRQLELFATKIWPEFQ